MYGKLFYHKVFYHLENSDQFMDFVRLYGLRRPAFLTTAHSETEQGCGMGGFYDRGARQRYIGYHVKGNAD